MVTSSLPHNSVHPHAGGENLLLAVSRFCHSGSPPRGWGKLHASVHQCRAVRFTPTRVGKTECSINCGHGALGSPPRGWGKLRPGTRRPARSRFTPTRVGKTFRGLARRRICTVHPHAGGENVPDRPNNSRPSVHPHAGGENTSAAGAQIVMAGSPPRGWGKPRLAASGDTVLRFTPTRVGKTQVAS